MLASWKNIRKGTTPIAAVPASWLLNLDRLPCDWLLTMVMSQSNNPVGLGNQSGWSGEPWANHGEPGHGKSGKCPELREGREVSAGVGVDPEVPGSMA